MGIKRYNISMKYETIISNKDYEKLYYLLKDNSLSEAYLSKLRQDQNNLLINGVPANMRSKVKKGDTISFALEVGKKTEIQTCEMDLDIVFEDEYLLIINKPPLVASTPTKSHYSLNLAGGVCNYMQKKTNNFVYRILNRLDKDTSGLVIIAKSPFSYQNTTNIEKTYEAVCEGEITSSLTIDKPIYTENINGINTIKRQISSLGKPATTFVEVIKAGKEYSHIKLKLLHGRTHQIRVHLSSIGHPLVGDIIYGKKSELISHTALICKTISLDHPKTRERMTFEAVYPENILSLLKHILR